MSDDAHYCHEAGCLRNTYCEKHQDKNSAPNQNLMTGQEWYDRFEKETFGAMSARDIQPGTSEYIAMVDAMRAARKAAGL